MPCKIVIPSHKRHDRVFAKKLDDIFCGSKSPVNMSRYEPQLYRSLYNWFQGGSPEELAARQKRYEQYKKDEKEAIFRENYADKLNHKDYNSYDAYTARYQAQAARNKANKSRYYW